MRLVRGRGGPEGSLPCADRGLPAHARRRLRRRSLREVAARGARERPRPIGPGPRLHREGVRDAGGCRPTLRRASGGRRSERPWSRTGRPRTTDRPRRVPGGKAAAAGSSERRLRVAAQVEDGRRAHSAVRVGTTSVGPVPQRRDGPALGRCEPRRKAPAGTGCGRPAEGGRGYRFEARRQELGALRLAPDGRMARRERWRSDPGTQRRSAEPGQPAGGEDGSGGNSPGGGSPATAATGDPRRPGAVPEDRESEWPTTGPRRGHPAGALGGFGARAARAGSKRARGRRRRAPQRSAKVVDVGTRRQRGSAPAVAVPSDVFDGFFDPFTRLRSTETREKRLRHEGRFPRPLRRPIFARAQPPT